MSRIVNMRNTVLATRERADKIRTLLANPNSAELPAIERTMLDRELSVLEHLERIQSGRLVYAEGKGEPNWIRMRDLGLGELATL